MPDLAQAAKALADRTLAYVAPPSGTRISPVLDCDAEMQRLAYAVLDALAPIGEAGLAGYDGALRAGTNKDSPPKVLP